MSTAVAVGVFALATAAVVVVAPRMAGVSEALTSRTRLGAALFGAIFLGASTSLPGIVVTVTAALGGQRGLAPANALGGIVAQTMFLALADISYRKGAAQREAVSRKSTAQLGLVVALLALVVIALGSPTRGSIRGGHLAGGNAFDVLFVAAADAAVLGGLYAALGSMHVLLAGVGLLFNAVLLMGFVRRGRGVGGRVAPESVIVLTAYVVVAAALVVA